MKTISDHGKVGDLTEKNTLKSWKSQEIEGEIRQDRGKSGNWGKYLKSGNIQACRAEVQKQRIYKSLRVCVCVLSFPSQIFFY